MSGGLPSIGRKSYRVRADSPRPVPVEVARDELAVPGLGSDNTFTGENTFDGSLSASQGLATPSVTHDGELVLATVDLLKLTRGSPVYLSLDLTAVSANRTITFPDHSGTFALTALRLAYVAKTGAYTLTDADCVCNCTSGTFTVTLPPAATVGAEKVYIVKNSGAGVITLDGDGAETIDGAATQTLAAGVSLTVVSTGSAWILV